MANELAKLFGVPEMVHEASSDVSAYFPTYDNTVVSTQNGDKFYKSFGPTKEIWKDYWALRRRSVQLFEENLYARGLIRRLITNIVNTGLTLEATPEHLILGIPEERLQDWSEETETRFGLWARNAHMVDVSEALNFGQMQEQAEMESLLAGDVLVVSQMDRKTNVPKYKLINGGAVQTPLASQRNKTKNQIIHGVEIDKKKRHVAYWILKGDGSYDRLPAWGERSGRRLAWLYYASDKRSGETRGTPLLALILQSLKDVDRYRDATTRKAVINSILALFMKKTEDKPASLAFQNGASRRGQVEVEAPNPPTDTSRYQFQEHLTPGLVLNELQHGEEPMAFGNGGIDEKFGEFESAMLSGIAWANEIPPEILTLAFSSNYSASQAALNEFKMLLNKKRVNGMGANFCQPIYEEWLVSEVLNGKIQAPGLLEAWRNQGRKYDILSAWLVADWAGAIKPSADPLKTTKAYELMFQRGFITAARATRELTGMKFSRVMKQQKRERKLMIEAGLTVQTDVQELSEEDMKDIDEAVNG